MQRVISLALDLDVHGSEAVTMKGAIEMSLCVKAVAIKADPLCSIPGSTECKERTDSSILSSDLHM